MPAVEEEYKITTLVKPDSEHIERVKEIFLNDIYQLFALNPEYAGKIVFSKKPRIRRHIINLSGREIETCRLEWLIKGEKDILEALLSEWKRLNFNPWRSFRFHREYSIPELKELMSIK